MPLEAESASDYSRWQLSVSGCAGSGRSDAATLTIVLPDSGAWERPGTLESVCGGDARFGLLVGQIGAGASPLEGP